MNRNFSKGFCFIAQKPANQEVKLFFSCVLAFKTIEAKNIPFGQYFLKRMKKVINRQKRPTFKGLKNGPSKEKNLTLFSLCFRTYCR